MRRLASLVAAVLTVVLAAWAPAYAQDSGELAKAAQNPIANMISLPFQYFVNYNMAGGWYLTSAPINTANWEADSGQRWTVPVGGGFGKIFKVGSQPMNAQAQAFYNVEKPEHVGDWSLRVQLQLLFPKGG